MMIRNKMIMISHQVKMMKTISMKTLIPMTTGIHLQKRSPQVVAVDPQETVQPPEKLKPNPPPPKNRIEKVTGV